jgi:hypothetical protein
VALRTLGKNVVQKILKGRKWKNRKRQRSSQKEKWNDAPMAALTSLISGCDTF